VAAPTGCSTCGSRAKHCAVCHHPDRADIDAQLAAGVDLRGVSRTFSLSEDALFRHRAKRHVVQQLVAHQRVRDELAQLDLLARIQHQDDLHREVMKAARETGDVRDQVAAVGIYVQTTKVIGQFKVAAQQHEDLAAFKRTIIQTLQGRHDEALWALGEVLDPSGA
jgi:hypothetical protein